jgi:hypothetical protein
LRVAENHVWRQWFDTAKAADIRAVALQFGCRLKKIGAAEYAGPCPVCGGVDRFSVNAQKGVFNCRKCENKGDVIDLVRFIAQCDTNEAIERITGTSRPNGAGGEQLREAPPPPDPDRVPNDQKAVLDIIRRAQALDGTHADEYLRKTRGLNPPRRMVGDLRFVRELEYWGQTANGANETVMLAVLPALVAVIRDYTGTLIQGAAITYLDAKEPRKWRPTGSSANSPKKVRGEKQGGLIRLGPLGDPLAIGEGWENVLAFWQLGLGPEEMGLAAAVDLGNMAGRALATVAHKAKFDAAGKPARIPDGRRPDPHHPGAILPDGVTQVILIADNDSESYLTAAKLAVATNRFMAQGKAVAIAWPEAGMDFDDMVIRDGS